MGVFDSWFGRRSDDPFQDLDPKVREFLKKESPVKLDDTQQPSKKNEPVTTARPASITAAATPSETTKSTVPKDSLYPDGRYAHLWKTYRPLSEIESETKSDEEKLRDVLDAFKKRKAEIGHAALENCAEEQVEWSNCMRGGTLRARMTMCSEEVRKFERCYNMQSRLLKALGYLNALDAGAGVEERIQMHADKLYHQMIDQERAAAQAEKEGKPLPKYEPLIPQQAVKDAKAAEESGAALMSEAAKKRVKDKLDKMDKRERDAEKAAIEAEIEAKAVMVAKIKDLWKEQEVEREERKARGEETYWDKTASFFKGSGTSGEKK